MSGDQLEIGIPTYNRAAKLGRTIALVRAQIREAGLQDRVSVRVHDNGSTDATPATCAEALAVEDGVRVRVLRHEKNVGFNRNIWSLYEACEAPYLWTFADDDLLYPGAVARVLEALNEHRPDALLFSFEQPPGSGRRNFQYPEPVHVERDPGMCVRHLWKQPKISAYVFRRATLSAEGRRLVDEQIPLAALAFIALGFSLVMDSERPTVVVISEPQATCDDDFLELRFVPDEWGRYDKLLQHPMVLRHAPELAERAGRDAYRSLLSVLWSWRAGSVTVPADDERVWWRSVEGLPARWPWLLERPGDLLRYAVLKSAPGRAPLALNRVAGRLRELRATVRARARGA